MGKRRRKDKDHDVGDSMPGTVGDSEGTIHDGKGGPSYNPDDVEVPEPSSNNSNCQQNKQPSQQESTETSASDQSLVESEEKTKRMKYAQKYGDSWPENRQRRFLNEHNVSAKEMGWKLTE
jgi:hypothetical protein